MASSISATTRIDRIGARYSVSQSSSVAAIASGRIARVHQQGFHGVAYAIAMGLGIQGNGFGLAQVRTVIHVHVADAVQVLDHGYPGITTDAFDQSLATARDNHIHIFGHADQCTYRG